MDTAIVVALVGIGGTLLNVTYTTLVAARSQRLAAELAKRDRDRERELAERERERERTRTKSEEVARIVRRYRDPVLRASFDLQSRLFNIIEKKFIETYHVDARPDAKQYACENTLFVLAEYLGWCEILRREVRFLDLGNEAQNKLWVGHLIAVRGVLQTDRFDPVLQVMHGQQRAIGELMIEEVENPADGATRQATIGYAAFVTRRRDDADFAQWFERLADDIATLAREPGRHTDRLAALQRALIDLIDFLDPDCERLPQSERTKLPEPGTA